MPLKMKLSEHFVQNDYKTEGRKDDTIPRKSTELIKPNTQEQVLDKRIENPQIVNSGNE
jgi:hypothetical protein